MTIKDSASKKNNFPVVVLAGGVGAARFLEGLIQLIPQEQITVIVNTGDDKEFYGLSVSPDLDIILYTLSGQVNPKTGWGINHDTFHTMQQLTLLGNEHWFMLGDRDLATHIHRTNMLKEGSTPSNIAENLRKTLGLRLSIIPMTDQNVETHINTTNGWLHFQEYLVKRRAQDKVLGIRFKGIEKAKPAPGVLSALHQAKAILIAPSNPLVSIGTILQVPGILSAIKQNPNPKIAVSPLIEGKPIKGPLDKLMKGMNLEVSSIGVARFYKQFLTTLIVDTRDNKVIPQIEKLGINTVSTNTLMSTYARKRALAKVVLQIAEYKG